MSESTLDRARQEGEYACPCKMDITEYLHGTMPRLVRCNYNCPCSGPMSGVCKWPGHAAIARLEAAARLAQIDKMVKEATYNMKRRREGPLHQCGEGDVICLMNRERDRLRREEKP